MLGSGNFNCKLKLHLKAASFNQQFFNLSIVGKGSAYPLYLPLFIQEMCFCSPHAIAHSHAYAGVCFCMFGLSSHFCKLHFTIDNREQNSMLAGCTSCCHVGWLEV